jgi:DnaK suppressor protein
MRRPAHHGGAGNAGGKFSQKSARVVEETAFAAYCLCVTSTSSRAPRKGEPMTTAKSSAAATPAAENGGRTTNNRKGPAKVSAKASAKAAPTVHAVPVEHQDKPGKPMNPKSLPVRPGEDPWTKAEINEVKQALIEDIARFESQIEISTAELVGLLRDGSEGAGRDPADVGSANFERDAEMSLANNAREMLDQSRLALRHIELGTYGSCDNCGQPIGKGRLQAFPRATLCVTCKQREERR